VTHRTVGRPDWARGLEKVILIQLFLTVIGATLAFGTVEPWSVALFELNALWMGLLLTILLSVDPVAPWSRQLFALPVWGVVLWAGCQMIPLAKGEGGPWPSPEGISWERLQLPTISMAPHLTRGAALKALSLAIYFSSALHVLRTTQRRRLAIRVLAGFGLLVATLSILQRLTSPRILYWIRPVSPHVAPFGPFGNYNHFAGLVELLFPLSLASLLFFRDRSERRILFGLSSVTLLVAGILSISRGGYLSITGQLLLGGIILWWDRSRRGGGGRSRGEQARTLLLGAIAVGMFSLWMGADTLSARLATIQQGTQEYSVVTRLAYWRAAWQIFLDHPLTGVGIGAFPAVYPRYGASSARFERVEEVHNDYLQLLVEMGVIGGALLLVWIGIGLTLWRRHARLWLETGRGDPAVLYGALLSLVGLALHSWVDFNLQIPSNALLFLLIAAMMPMPEREVPERVWETVGTHGGAGEMRRPTA
jgi:O-antigen ligase